MPYSFCCNVVTFSFFPIVMAHLILFSLAETLLQLGGKIHIQLTNVSAGLWPVTTSQISITAVLQQSLPRGNPEMK